MKAAQPARVALAVLQWLAPRNEPLAGDLLEEFQKRQSALWLWSQILLAVALGSFHERRVPVALNLTPVDPAVAEWLMDRALSKRRINLTGTPIEGVGGLSLMALGFLMSAVVPAVWWFVLGGILSGLVLGTAMVMRSRSSMPIDPRQRFATVWNR
jgi:MFS family permease